MKKYDYLIVGAGLFGAIFAYEATKRGNKCIVIEKRHHIGGNMYCENIEGINVHEYGAHIFHTSNREAWEYINKFLEFNQYVNSPIANYNGEIYNLPFNMNTFSKLWGIFTPKEAKDIIENQKGAITKTPSNLEEQAISLVGTDIYEKLIKGYTEKQWGRKATELPSFIIKRLPVRFTYDNNYFNDRYQGIPIGGYNPLFKQLLTGIEVQLETDYFTNRDYFNSLADKIVYTGMIDQFYDYQYGVLDYRSLNFETEVLDTENYQGNAVVNYTDSNTPFTRIIEHKHFEFGTQEKTVITREYPANWNLGDEPYYPVNDDKNNQLFEKYKSLSEGEKNVIFGGRLGDYKYYDMHHVILNALDIVSKEFGN
ncbi:UDP-galactopyranose mutase [Turicibacter sanguinis]|uniref:UDP-galactopyranose mutase n=1 Tax=Turicibacter sanguinis TaxID=154288 RepID=UPI0018ABCDE2|nr:UDP-galactopyranose mutase [Turicibacter sanguinis]MDB8558549.1 UDP-galactopyranose mutase [Turicibacter sanguinis]MDB8561345.1 UDP-galactopyranose mutase [Turicibacter sanguinis]